MPISELRLIKRSAEFIPKDDVSLVPPFTRGIYVLLNERPKKKRFDVVYVGMARGTKSGIRGRLLGHKKGPKKQDKWTHFSIFEVWDNIRENEIEELEGLFRHIYRFDTQANALNVQKSYGKLKRVRNDNLDEW